MATCGPCPKGYEGDGTTCDDIDEVRGVALTDSSSCCLVFFKQTRETPENRAELPYNKIAKFSCRKTM